MPNWILDRILAFDTIVLFRHVFADMDALGSQLGFATWLKEAYPSKKVYCLGEASFLSNKMNETMDQIDEAKLQEALGIIFDTSNAARVDDDRYRLCKHTIRIDHHVQVESFCDEEWIDEKASATCEMLGIFFQSIQATLPKKAAQYLYNGLMADSIRLTISSVRAQSFEVAKYLFEQGVDVVASNQFNFSTSVKDYRYETMVRNQMHVENQFAYAILHQEAYQQAGLTFTQAKEKVHVFSGIDEIEIWALFTEMETKGFYSASLRSKQIFVRDIAIQFGGGGHLCACGIKNLTLEEVKMLISLLKEISIG